MGSDNRHTRLGATVVAIALAFGAGCGDDETSLVFPSLSDAVMTTFCVRGNATIGETKSGAVSSTDCDSADVDPADASYYEVYLVKVRSSASVTFDVSSNFDSFLTLLTLDSYTATTVSLTQIIFNDDRSASDLDALLTHTLHPDTDYVLVISGYDYSETGTYSLQIR